MSVFGSADSTRLNVGVSTCNAEPVVTATETSSEVRLVVHIRTRQSGTECLDGAFVDLSEPLGDRAVIDAETGETLELLPPEE